MNKQAIKLIRRLSRFDCEDWKVIFSLLWHGDWARLKFFLMNDYAKKEKKQ